MKTLIQLAIWLLLWLPVFGATTNIVPVTRSVSMGTNGLQVTTVPYAMTSTLITNSPMAYTNGAFWMRDAGMFFDASSSSITNRIVFGQAGSEYAWIERWNQTGDLLIGVQNTERMRMRADGVIGMRYDTPFGWLYEYGSTLQSHVITGGGTNQMDFRVLSFSADGPVFSWRGYTTDNLMILRNGGSLGLGFDWPEALLSVNGGAHIGGTSDPGDNNLWVDGFTTIYGSFIMETAPDTYGFRISNTTNRWLVATTGAESTGNAGSDLAISRYADDATPLGTAITIKRATGNVGVGYSIPTAKLHIAAGAVGAGNASLKFNEGVLLGTPEEGAVEYATNELYATLGSTRLFMLNSASQVIGAGTDYSLTTTVTNVDFGTTDPNITLPLPGTYSVAYRVHYAVGAVAADAFSFGLYNKTTESFVPGSWSHEDGHVANEHQSAGVAQIILTTTTADNVIHLQGANDSAARGSVVSTNTYVSYLRVN